jgi:hypothetical protein
MFMADKALPRRKVPFSDAGQRRAGALAGAAVAQRLR